MPNEPSRRSWWAAALLLLLFVKLGLVYGRIIIDGDGLSYYALTTSLVHDHDFDLENQKKQIQGVMAPRNERTKAFLARFTA